MKTFFKIAAVFTIALLLSNCEENEFATKESIDSSTIAFAQTEFLAELDTINSVYKLEVQMTDLSDVDRVFTVKQISLDSVSGNRPDLIPAALDDFTFDNKITVPAGSYKGYGDINVNQANLVLGVERSAAFELTVDGVDTKARLPRLKTIVHFTRACEFTKVVLSIKFDNYPEETSWELYDSVGNLVDADGPFPQTAEFIGQNYKRTFCLENGDYTFAFNDVYGDGICCGAGAGSYKLEVNGVAIKTGGEFEFQELTEFTINK